MRVVRFIILLLIIATCDSGSPLSLGPPSPFRKVREHVITEAIGLPSGVAVTPDGRWLVSLGFTASSITLYEAPTLNPVVGPLHVLYSVEGDYAGVGKPHAVVISPDGSFAVVAAQTGVFGVSLPSLQLLFEYPNGPCDPTTSCSIQPRYLVRDRAGKNYYLSSMGRGIARMTAAGDPGAYFDDANFTTAMSLTRDERELLVVTEGRRLLVLSTPDLSLRLSIDMPPGFGAQVVVPLQTAGRAILVGGASAGETSVSGPLLALPVDLATGSLGSLQVLAEGGGIINLGDGNEWADVGTATALVPTTAGLVAIDTNLGTVTLYSAAELQRYSPPCCDIASYPGGDRFVIATLGSESTTGPGSLIVYDFDEQLLSTSN